ncbi:MAG TPA: class I SAM-dependent rRNA methyltransferase [Candidatus Acidoferrales bacterium]|nr:class I SAM-dependent rRNA methyltransferase [Candidatus Acidoferrales bacterium]
MAENRVVIGPRGVERLRSGHLWVYRSDVRAADAEPGAVVRVMDERGRFLGRAFYSDRSQISIRLVTHDDVEVDRAFLRDRLFAAAEFRKRTVGDSEVFRLIYGEADQIPSLVVDRYGEYLAMQNLCQSVDRFQPLLVDLLVELFAPRGIIERNDPKVRLLEGLDQRVSVLHGEVPEEVRAHEDGLLFSYDLHHGQKTGGFLDQRENHQAAANFAAGEVLDCFCYHGGFALTVAPKAESVEAVDLSPAAVAAARRNQELNQIANVSFREANSFDLLKQFDEEERRFDMVILDPPAFAKNRDSIPAAHRGYKEINLRAMKILKRGGCLVTCSCSHHISEALFLQIVAEAANDAHRTIVVVERRTQSRDHPILLTVPETHYLKCLILRVL